MSDPLLDLDWDSLQGPYGPASEVPNLLETLRSPNPTARTDAERQLKDHLQHQGLVAEPAAAAAPYLIRLLADREAPDRLVAYRLLRMILDTVELYESPNPTPVPTLADLASRRSDWWLARSPAWRKHGGYQPAVTNPCHARAYAAVRAGIPAYLDLIQDDDRNLRLGATYLLAHIPQDRPTVAPVLARQLATETDPPAAAAMCIAAGLVGNPDDNDLRNAVAPWRDHPDPVVHRTALIGLAGLLTEPDTPLLIELGNCLRHEWDPIDWPIYGRNLANSAAAVLGSRTPQSIPHLANILTAQLWEPTSDRRRDFLALELLLGVAFPDGPLPDGTAYINLTPPQQDIVRLVLDTRLLMWGAMMTRAIGECNLPNTHKALEAWRAGTTIE